MAAFLTTLLGLPPSPTVEGISSPHQEEVHAHLCAYEQNSGCSTLKSHDDHGDHAVLTQNDSESEESSHSHSHRHSPTEPEHSHEHHHTASHSHSGPYITLSSVHFDIHIETNSKFDPNIDGACKEPYKNSLFRPPIA